MALFRRLFASLPVQLQRPVVRLLKRRRTDTRPRSVAALIAGALGDLRPWRTAGREGAPRIVLAIDSIVPEQLMGGAGTALLLAAALAEAWNRPLTIVTRQQRHDLPALRALLRLQEQPFEGAIEVRHFTGAPGDQPVPIGRDDLVLTTSWWSTWSVRRAVPARQIVYLLQEDERMFYPGGDQQLLCDETLADTAIRYVVNTALLLEHFRGGDAPGPADGTAFEPAFPRSIYHPEPHGERLNLFFYARPNHPRNLFLRGVAALERAFAEGLFPAARWDVHFFGVDVPRVDMGGRAIRYHDTVPWADYARLVRTADLGLSLMYTPHPSYPPLDLAASGAVVVTNRFGPKGREPRYCDNILYAPLSVDGLVAALREGAARAEDVAARRAALDRATLSRDWRASFAPVVRALAAPGPA